MEYVPRLVDKQLRRLLADVPAVAVDGPRAVGKSSTAAQFAQSVINLDQPDERELTSADRARLTRLPSPVLIDEWQLLPPVWDQVRRAVDAGAAAGSFILAGSSSPVQRPTHSGAGRIVRLRMRPMSLAERQLVAPSVSLAALLTGTRGNVTDESPITLEQYANEITMTGFPGIRKVPERSRRDVIDGYLASIVDRDFAEAGSPVRRPSALRAWLRSYASATSSNASYTRILDVATPGEGEKPAKATTIAYRDTLQRMWLVDELPAWAGHTHLTGLTGAPKHHLADPGLAARLLGVNASGLLDETNPDRSSMPRVGTLVGALFESLATLCVRVYAQACNSTVSHLRTANGAHEIDLIVESDDGRVLPIEVKLAGTVNDDDVKHLHWLRRRLGSEVLDAVVITTGKAAYRRGDGVAVVPLALLGP